jgi:hypothetical protein
MGAGIWNLLFGVAFIVGGLSGRIALIGTQSPGAAVAVGAVMAAWGGWQLWRSRKRK